MSQTGARQKSFNFTSKKIIQLGLQKRERRKPPLATTLLRKILIVSYILSLMGRSSRGAAPEGNP
jgi:hypothetical protein